MFSFSDVVVYVSTEQILSMNTSFEKKEYNKFETFQVETKITNIKKVLKGDNIFI